MRTIAALSCLLTLAGCLDGTISGPAHLVDAGIDGADAAVVQTGNRLPTVNAGIDQSLSLPAGGITLTGSGSDPDGDPLTYAWTQTAGATVVISSPTTADTLVTGLVLGSYTFQLSVSDGHGGAADDTTQVVVTPTTIYFIAVSGDDTTGSGTAADPWQTLSKACTVVTTAGSLIRVTSGTYPETQPCVLAVGVSIEGEGVASHIVSSHKASSILDGAIILDSPSEGTDGRQSISNLKLDGNLLAADNAIVLHARSNVKLHDLTIVDFYANAVQFNGKVDTLETVGRPPAIYATGNELYKSTITNCSTRKAFVTRPHLAIGMIEVTGQQDLPIHDNVLTQTSRPPGDNGNILAAIAGHNQGLKFFRNKSYKPDNEGQAIPTDERWNFHIEHWNSTGGMEIYDNEFWGGSAIDASGDLSIKGTYSSSWWIHDNLFALRSQAPTYQTPFLVGVTFEGTVEDAIVNNNHFKNLVEGVQFSLQFNTTHQRNIRVYDNLFENIGYANGDFAFPIATDVTGAAMTLEDIFIDNNTMVATVTAGKASGALLLNATGTVQRIYLRNNIISELGGFGYLAFWANTGTIDSVYSQNNVLYNNPNANAPYYGGGKTVSNFVSQNNLTSNPMFVSTSDFSLQSSSPAIEHGIDVGLPYTGGAPSIGALEYGSPSTLK